MEQIALSFSAPLARRRDPQTSHDAAERARKFVASHEARILGQLYRRPALTYREIAECAGMEPVAVARRLKDMERKGVVVRDGERDGMTCWRAA